MKVERRYPQGFEVIEYAEGVVVAVTESDNKLIAMCFTGKRSKPDWHYRFKNKEQLDAEITKTINIQRSHKQRKEDQKVSRRNKVQELKQTLKVGDILHTSFGYEQTNNYFFQVTGFKGAKVLARAIGKVQVEGTDGFMSCKVKAHKNKFIGEEKAYTLTAYGISKAIYDYSASPCIATDEFYESWYA